MKQRLTIEAQHVEETDHLIRTLHGKTFAEPISSIGSLFDTTIIRTGNDTASHLFRHFEKIEVEREINITLEEYKLPEHWACALFYGDYSGLDDDDQRALEDWLAEHPHIAETPADMTDEGEFLRYHDARAYGVLACMCATYHFPVIEKDAQP